MPIHRKLTYDELKQASVDPESMDTIARNPIYVVLENVRSLFNVGSIFRTADALRVEQMMLTGFTGRPPRKEIDKVALGSVDSVPWKSFKSTAEAISELKNSGTKIIALEQTVDSIDFQAYSFQFPSAIVLGNEFEGVEQATLDLCDDCIEIPMLGTKQSLNVGTAFGIIGYEMLRRLRGQA